MILGCAPEQLFQRGVQINNAAARSQPGAVSYIQNSPAAGCQRAASAGVRAPRRVAAGRCGGGAGVAHRRPGQSADAGGPPPGTKQKRPADHQFQRAKEQADPCAGPDGVMVAAAAAANRGSGFAKWPAWPGLPARPAAFWFWGGCGAGPGRGGSHIKKMKARTPDGDRVEVKANNQALPPRAKPHRPDQTDRGVVVSRASRGRHASRRAV